MKFFHTYEQHQLVNEFLETNSKLLEQTTLDGKMQSLKGKVRTLIKSYLTGKGYDTSSKKYANDLTLLTYAVLHILNQYK
tara:strand:+ start:20496 stop:20735 length:240 start_codon:yes stop_codon:yes gene_type:complete